MLGILIDNIFAMLGGYVCQQTICIPTGINCVFLDDLFLYSYKATTVGFCRKNLKKLTLLINLMFCYIDHFLSLNNLNFGTYVYRFLPIQLEIKDLT